MTPHINAKKGDIAKFVLMPGDPLRAKHMAEQFLENPRLVNTVRNVFMYTGTYKGKEVTIAASGMGNASIGIYSHELYANYGVESIIRVGSAGAYTKDLNLYDVILATEAYTDNDSFGEIIAGIKSNIWKPSSSLNDKLIASAKKAGIEVKLERVHSSDVFYAVRDLDETIKLTQAAAVEMESSALFAVAKKLNKKAACLLTISDNLVTHEETSSEERQNKFTKMIEVALGAI
ncbi:purine-nucleoside phosphorylase [Mycoplasma testudineum]|uniref:Uridine phosphorylase n=1 Tax=Mycoplasma testudineum TaxID=244584 RepID=A0A4R6IFP0_9MOLU|nr:purine-nucleoside phosphorylase [Mycoplasma testudineum]OYD27076.1 purine-nucleoside phosphorylase [Mycoplasma testudineum]TDO21170.1 purine-nucleoside phosphorylase [Mycoplasma testudineum]